MMSVCNMYSTRRAEGRNEEWRGDPSAYYLLLTDVTNSIKRTDRQAGRPTDPQEDRDG